MTRVAAKNALVLDGNTVKLRLMAERQFSKALVHIDWLRFTVQLRNAPPFLTDKRAETTSIWDEGYRLNKLLSIINELPDPERDACGQAADLADRVCMALGFEFTRGADLGKGHDFYKRRWSIQRNGAEVGWVGFGASSDSPRQRSQAETIHVNLYGLACTFAEHGWNDRMAKIVDDLDAKITRADLALDFFEGFQGGIERVSEEYKAGLCDVNGQRPKMRDINWLKGSSRSLYLGSKEAGKETNIYEKGDQLFGEEAGSDWLRFELRYGNKLRYLESDILRRPSDFFAGASEWHAAILREAGEIALPERVSTTPKAALMSVKAECVRNARWAMETAAPTIATLFQYLDEDQFLELVTGKKLPKRLQAFSKADLQEAFGEAFNQFVVPRSGPVAMGLH
ncbi:replication initiation factor domain-containing protein [Variovorax sp. 375MFSha3.1]|uniref:replication initiation factor domain-containing protein n=1 Tax=Variovorax sp. 375MFSha3.1 TaxID=3158364 RepID=UPI003AAFE11B